MGTIAKEGGDLSSVIYGTIEAYTDELNYTTIANNISAPEPMQIKYYPLTYQVVATILYIIVGVAAVVGNMMVILVVWRVPHMRTPTNCYLVSLAVADATTGLVTVLLHSVAENVIPTGTFAFGLVLCYIIIPLEYIAFNVSALSITAFTVERYIAICYPMKSKLICSVSRASKIIIALWIFEIAYSVFYIIIIDYSYTSHTTDGHGYHICWYRDLPKFIQTVYLMDVALYYVVPVGLSVVLYSLIARVLFKSTKMSSNMQSGYEPVPMKSKHENGNCESAEDKKAKKKLMKKEKKSHKDNTVSSRKQVRIWNLDQILFKFLLMCCMSKMRYLVANFLSNRSKVIL